MPAEICECGCPEVAHQTVPLAVDLIARPGGPLYKIPGSGIGSTRTGATRFAEQCSGCGCMSFQADHYGTGMFWLADA